MTVKVITDTNPRGFEESLQAAIDAADSRGETLHDIKFSTSTAILPTDAKDFWWNPEEHSACWFSAILIFY